jgi:hypothetical protein
MLSISHFLDNRLTDGGEFVSLTRRPCSNPHKRCLLFLVLFSNIGWANPRAYCRWRDSVKLIGSRTRDLSTCSLMAYIKMAETLGTVHTRTRGLLRRWWWPVGPQFSAAFPVSSLNSDVERSNCVSCMSAIYHCHNGIIRQADSVASC